jgi:uncharacterized protein YbaR (Trm112 family)
MKVKKNRNWIVIMIDSKLLEILACPYCRGDVEYKTKEETITCLDCGLIYNVVDGIPIMIIEKAVNYEEKKDSLSELSIDKEQCLFQFGENQDK